MRRPAVAGQFYPGDPGKLEKLITELTPPSPAEKIRSSGIVVPHAGYVYSGMVAAQVFASIEPVPTFVVLGPNHRAYGSAVALSVESWLTPLGIIEIDEDFIRLLPRNIIDVDETAHRMEHSLEVQVPFIQHFFKGSKIVPICLGLQDEDTAKDVSDELVEAIKKYDKPVVIVASSDFTHYEDIDIARKKDSILIKKIEELDVSGFYNELYRLNASCCGYGPISVMMLACKSLGAEHAKLLKYSTSGDITGDREVVGYAGIVVF